MEAVADQQIRGGGGGEVSALPFNKGVASRAESSETSAGSA